MNIRNTPIAQLSLLLFYVLSISSLQAAGVSSNLHSLDDIQSSVHRFVVSQQTPDTSVEVSVKPLDRRLRLTSCAEPLKTSWSPGSRQLGRVTVLVECSTHKPWRIHVQATATIEGLVWVLDRGVRRGDVLVRSMLKQQTVTIGGTNTIMRSSGMPVVNIDHWLGFAFSRRVGAGMVLDERMLEPADLVGKGESVLIVHESVGLQLQTKGIALNAAALGNRVQVRNSTSGKVVEATVIARGLVTVLQ